MKNYLLVMAISLFISGCIATSGLKAYHPVGQEHSKLIKIAGKEVPLPVGSWKIIGSGYTKGRDDKYFEVYLLSVTDSNQIKGLIRITTETVFNNYAGYFKNKYCERTNVHYTNVTKNTDDGIDCFVINHVRMSIKPDSTAKKEVFNYIRSNNYILPKNMILGYHIFTGDVIENAYLQVKHYVNPEVDGFEPPKESSWSSSDWHPLQIGNDPQKVSYIENFKSDSALYHEQIRANFDL